MRCRSCHTPTTPKTSIKVSHEQSKDAVRLCTSCFSGPGRAIVAARFGSLVKAKKGKGPKGSAKVVTDAWGDNERARQSRERGREKSRQLREERAS